MIYLGCLFILYYYRFSSELQKGIHSLRKQELNRWLFSAYEDGTWYICVGVGSLFILKLSNCLVHSDLDIHCFQTTGCTAHFWYTCLWKGQELVLGFLLLLSFFSGGPRWLTMFLLSVMIPSFYFQYLNSILPISWLAVEIWSFFLLFFAVLLHFAETLFP